MSRHPAVAFLLAAHQQAEGLARAAGGVEVEAVDYLWETKYLNVRQPDGGTRQTTKFSAELADHFALHDPAAVLRRVAAERKLLAEHADDGYRDCVRCADDGLPVECGPGGGVLERSALPWPCRTVLLLAEAWGWTEGASC